MFSTKFRIFIPSSIIVRTMATVKRFYREATVLSSGNKFEIALDHRKLKTPKGKVFEVSSEPLAFAIAVEWESQKETINRSNMHLTSLCNTVLDNPHNNTKEDIVSSIIQFLETDTILFQSNDEEELYNLQVEKWDPLIQWFCDRFQLGITKTRSIEAPLVTTETKEIIRKHLMSYNFEAIHGFKFGVDTTKSVILTLAASERVIKVEDAVYLSRLEEEYQISHWGRVEWSHELSKYDLQARLAAAIIFIHLNSNSMTSEPKLDRIRKTEM
ncbi:ATP synthase mitochondrial F1 complex assembly factor 2 [Belonocnema kinseyi]|uniref:ATP synthase mitochondrial F1 complex assembly factor 2 n=1 Tax=Belonocnema kinseyi TaxID=2817044 RepID=UPI00143DD78C|nr:ATP synthase mitochondrial F1 complex assembly factor 2 [Belonocnema kinseyi]